MATQFQYAPKPLTFFDADKECQKDGGRLASIDSSRQSALMWGEKAYTVVAGFTTVSDSYPVAYFLYFTSSGKKNRLLA